MIEPIVYVDYSEVREGKLEELKMAMRDLVEFVEANEPRMISYNVFFSNGGSRMTVMHINPDNASLANHMKVAGPEFPKVAGFIRLLSIDVYGNPSDDLVDQMRKKAQLLGNGTVCVHELHAGFARLGVQ